MLYLLERGYIQKTHSGDFGLNCEPTNLREMDIGTKGVLRVDVVVQGKGAFNARPYRGISVIDKAIKFIQDIQ